MIYRIEIVVGGDGIVHAYGEPPDGWVVHNKGGTVLVCKYAKGSPKFKYDYFRNLQTGTIAIDPVDAHVSFRYKEQQRIMDYYGIDKLDKETREYARIKIFENHDGTYTNQIYGYNNIEFVDCLTKREDDGRISHICTIKLLSDESFVFVKGADTSRLCYRSSLYYLAKSGLLLYMDHDLTEEFINNSILADHKVID